MTEADALLTVGSLLCALLAVMGALYFKRALAWLIATIFWIFVSVNALRLAAAEWDEMYFVFFLGIGVTVICVLMSLQTRGMEEEEEAGEEGMTLDDSDHYINEAKGHGDRQKKLSDATGGPRVRRR